MTMTLQEKIHIFENSKITADCFTSEALTATYVEALAALYDREKEGDCSGCVNEEKSRYEDCCWNCLRNRRTKRDLYRRKEGTP